MRIREKQKSPLPDRHLAGPATPASGEGSDGEETVLAAAGLIGLPTESLPESLWKMPAPQISFEDSVSAVTSEGDEV